MNYLAHLFLSFEDKDIITGNFLGDLISNKTVKTYPEGIRKGVIIHRKIDSFTDQHPLVLQGVRRLYAKHHKYASVLIDIFYDYMLSQNWSTYANESLQDFANKIYAALESNTPQMSIKIQDRVKRMVDANWLISYQHTDGIAYAIDKVKQRVSKPELFANSIESLLDNYDMMNEEFNVFFPEIIGYLHKEMGVNTERPKSP